MLDSSIPNWYAAICGRESVLVLARLHSMKRKYHEGSGRQVRSDAVLTPDDKRAKAIANSAAWRAAHPRGRWVQQAPPIA